LIKPHHLEQLVILYLRQSSLRQVRDNSGSTKLQKGQENLALEYGWSPKQIRVIDEDLGRSGLSVIALVDGFVSGEIDGFPVSRSHAL